MTDKTKDARAHRRDFLKLASGGVVAGGAVVAGGVAAEAKDISLAQGPADGYRETDHVRRYYELAR